MKSELSLEQLAKQLTDNGSKKKDFIAESKNLEFVANGNIQLHSKELNESFDVNNICLSQISTKAGMPKKYLDKMLDGHRGLLMENINYWWVTTPQQQMIRTLDGVARAFLSDKYKRVDNDELARVVLPILLDNGYKVISCAITDSRMSIKAVLPTLQREVTKGDVVEAGVMITNSEVGLGSVNVSPFIHRIVCVNGMVVNDSRLHSRHLTASQATIDGVYEVLSDEAKELDNKALLTKVRDVVLSTGDKVRFENNVAKMTNATEIKIKKPKKVIEVLENRFDLTKQEGEDILENLINRDDKQPTANVWSVVNSITALGNTLDDYDRGTKMQSIGGVLLDTPELIAA